MLSINKKLYSKKFILILTAAIILGSLFYFNQKAIFQRGNFFPYLISAAKLNEENPYALVKASDKLPSHHTYISHRNSSEKFIDFIENEFDAQFTEQAGSAYIFSADSFSFSISSEIYWGKYILWDIPVLNA